MDHPPGHYLRSQNAEWVVHLDTDFIQDYELGVEPKCESRALALCDNNPGRESAVIGRIKNRAVNGRSAARSHNRIKE